MHLSALTAATLFLLPLFGTNLHAATKEPDGYAMIRKHLSERVPGLPKIEEIRPSGFPGMFEIRVGADIAYTDAKGDYLIRGSLLRTADKKELTALRIEDLQRIQFKDLPLDGAIVRKTGTGKRKVVIFEDPNCGYCKKLAHDLESVPDLTSYIVMVPILSQDSAVKAGGIWCSKDRAQSWSDWMLRGVTPAKAPSDCKVPLVSNLAFARLHDITGTPTIFFEDGSRKVGALTPADFAEKLNQTIPAQ